MGGYRALKKVGYEHSVVVHSRRQYVAGHVHTQNVENLWSSVKRGIKGVYRHVDPKYVQAYADEYAFRYSHRNDFQPMFWALLDQVSKLVYSQCSKIANVMVSKPWRDLYEHKYE